jgi:tetratricopeptide (TPR) repeat protein
MRLKLGLLLIVTTGLLLSCAGLGIQPDAQSAFETGLALFNKGKYQKAIVHFQKATELDPNFSQGYLYMGRSYLNLSQWLDAVPPLRTALRLSPEETRKEVVPLLIDALLGAATMQLKQRNFQSSLDTLKEALELQPQSAPATQQLVTTLLVFGSSLLSQGKITAAIDVYTEATHLAPQNLEAYLGLARAFFRNGNTPQALTAAKTALRIAPTNLRALLMLRRLQER